MIILYLELLPGRNNKRELDYGHATKRHRRIARALHRSRSHRHHRLSSPLFMLLSLYRRESACVRIH